MARNKTPKRFEIETVTVYDENERPLVGCSLYFKVEAEFSNEVRRSIASIVRLTLVKTLDEVGKQNSEISQCQTD